MLGQLSKMQKFPLNPHTLRAVQNRSCSMSSEQASQSNTSWGYETGFTDTYRVLGQVGKGGNGVVNRVVHKASGREYACKVLPKHLADTRASDQKRAAHPESVRNEVEAMLLLRGTLNVACLEAVYEDKHCVYIVMELCRGGDIFKAMKTNPSNETMLASIIRAVLQVVAHCHAVRFLHRDIKPENFLLSEAGERGHVKAIDFGLAVPFNPACLPLSVSMLEGTPWYLAPEACRGKFEPATDVWAVGAMTAQLLTGELPFNDPLSPKMPSMQRVLRSIVCSEVDYGKKCWSKVSPLARELVASFLRKEPASRPSAAQALKHPWIQGGMSTEPAGMRKIDKSVVQRLQRFANASYFKRSVLGHIAADMLTLQARDQPLDTRMTSFLRLPQSSAAADFDRSVRGGSQFSYGASIRNGLAFFTNRSIRGGAALPPSGRNPAKSGVEGPPTGAKSGAAALPPRSWGDASARAGSRHGRSMHGGSLHGTRIDETAAAPADTGERVSGNDFEEPRNAGAHPRSECATPDPIATPYAERLQSLLKVLQLNRVDAKINREGLAEGLWQLGYDVDQDEVDALVRQLDVDKSGHLDSAEVAASIIDWHALQGRYRDLWQEYARRAFEQIDTDGSGYIEREELVAYLANKLSPYEVEPLVRLTLAEAMGEEEGGPGRGLSLSQFSQLLTAGNTSLALYDARTARPPKNEGESPSLLALASP
ncbi:g3128 [Coccomyxa elongata]